MKITFEDRSYIEVIRSPTPGKVLITIVARDPKEQLATVANSVEITEEQLQQLTDLE